MNSKEWRRYINYNSDESKRIPSVYEEKLVADLQAAEKAAPGGLRAKIDAVITGEFLHSRLSEAEKQDLDDRMDAGEDVLFYVWAMGRLSLARELAALQSPVPQTPKETKG